MRWPWITPLYQEWTKWTIHLLQNRTVLFALDRIFFGRDQKEGKVLRKGARPGEKEEMALKSTAVDGIVG
ncbi:MAG TPA: hypothetical protein P5244_08070 [Syntrophales bacterium]|nr:hypothetical protein [Syntrophales bacterium]